MVKSSIVFACYSFYLVSLYLLVWQLFLSSIIRELWKTKTLLAIIPPEKLMDTSEIREYILRNSQAAFFSKKAS